jgi:histidine triad (HIT) family protein
MSDEKTVFERIISGELPHRKLYEDDLVYAFLDAFPNHPGHSLVVPKVAYRDLFALPDDVTARMFQVARDLAIAVKEATQAEGINISMNNGAAAGQEVFHAHVHVIPRREGDGGYLGQHRPYANDAEADALSEKIRLVLSR